MELVDRKRSVSTSWPSGSSPLKSGSARRAKEGGPRVGQASSWVGLRAGWGRKGRRVEWPEDRVGRGGGRAALAHPLTHSLAQHARVRAYAWALGEQR